MELHGIKHGSNSGLNPIIPRSTLADRKSESRAVRPWSQCASISPQVLISLAGIKRPTHPQERPAHGTHTKLAPEKELLSHPSSLPQPGLGAQARGEVRQSCIPDSKRGRGTVLFLRDKGAGAAEETGVLRGCGKCGGSCRVRFPVGRSEGVCQGGPGGHGLAPGPTGFPGYLGKVQEAQPPSSPWWHPAASLRRRLTSGQAV